MNSAQICAVFESTDVDCFQTVIQCLIFRDIGEGKICEGCAGAICVFPDCQERFRENRVREGRASIESSLADVGQSLRQVDGFKGSTSLESTSVGLSASVIINCFQG